MKKIFFNIITLLLVCFTQAQWKQVSILNNANVTVLKKVNGVCFAYGIDTNSFQGKLYRSNNNGKAWIAVDSVVFKFIIVNDITYDSAHSKFVIITNAQNGIFTSSDGNTWTSTGTDMSGNAITYINSRLVASTASNPDVGIGVSTDGGNSFSISDVGLPYPYYVHNLTRIDNTLYLTIQEPAPCYISNNGGASWAAQSNNLSNFTYCFYKFNGKLYIGTYLTGVKKFNTNKNAWGGFNKGLPSTSNIYALASKSDSLFCGGDTIGVWMNTNNVWSNFSSGLPAKTTVHKLLTLSGHVFAATATGLWKINLSSPAFNEPATADENNNKSEKITNTSIKVFPTVTLGKLTIQSTALPETIMLINENGQVVKIWSNKTELNINDVPAGNYFLRLNVNAKIYTQQIIKIN